MELRTAASPKDVKYYTTERLREEFLIQGLFVPDAIKMVYSHIDRIITGAAVPAQKTLALTAGDELRADYFLQRREMGIINIGGCGTVTVDGKDYEVAPKTVCTSAWEQRTFPLRAQTPPAPRSFISTAPRRIPAILPS